MPATEQLVAITETLGRHGPFRAVVKQLVDDFIVKEVMRNGQIAHLTRLPILRPKRKRPDTSQVSANSSSAAEVPPNAPPSDLHLATLDSFFPNLDNQEDKPASTAVRAMLANTAKDAVAVLPPCLDKATRTRIHEWVREHLPRFISDTVASDTGSSIRIRPVEGVRPSKRRRSDRERFESRPGGSGLRGSDDAYADSIPRGAAIQFVLWKRGRDTTDAIFELAKLLHVHSSTFTYAGTKDKRAVTTQMVQTRNVHENSFAHANRILAQRPSGPSLVIGDVAVAAKRQLKLGDLKGNRFTLVLRDLEVAGDGDVANVESAVRNLQHLGFVNYFGLQRFGSGVSPTHETGFALLRGDYEDVCRRILLPLMVGDPAKGGEHEVRPERRRMITALEQFAVKQITAKELLAVLPWRMSVECAIVKAFVEDEKRGIKKYDYQAAFSQLPRNLRRMYGHAVQSYLWNIMASARIRMHCPNEEGMLHAIAGDLIIVDETKDSEVNFLSKVRVVTKNEEESKSISVYRVVIPVIGSDVDVPDGVCGEAASKILQEQNLDMKKRPPSNYDLKGTYRKLLAKPVDVEMKIVPYSDKNQILTDIGTEHLDLQMYSKENKKSNNASSNEGCTQPIKTNSEAADAKTVANESEKGGIGNLGLQVNSDADAEAKSVEKKESTADETAMMDCAGTAKIENEVETEDFKLENVAAVESATSNGQRAEAVPEQESKVESVALKDEALVAKEGVQGEAKEVDDSTKASETPDDKDVVGAQDCGSVREGSTDENKANGTGKEKENKGHALVLSFTLGCAEYATMLVRELTKHDSSTANQIALQERAA